MATTDDPTDDPATGAPPIRTHVRRRRMAPLAVPIGIAALGLGAIGTIQDVPNRHSVESRLTDRSVTALSDAGISGYVVFDGRDATVHVASADDRERALAVVRAQQGVRVAHVVVDRPASKVHRAGPKVDQPPSKVDRPQPKVDRPQPKVDRPQPRVRVPANAAPAKTAVPNGARASVQAALAALGPIRFGTGSMSLTPTARLEVARIAAILRTYPDGRVTIDGFTDSSGGSASNLALSSQRAQTVYHTLRVLGIPSSRMTTEGHGEADPLVPNDSAVHRAANRRVTVTIQ